MWVIKKLPACTYQNRIPNTLVEWPPTMGARTQNVYNFGSHINYRTRIWAPAIEGLSSPQSSSRQICLVSLIMKSTIRLQELIYRLFRCCKAFCVDIVCWGTHCGRSLCQIVGNLILLWVCKGMQQLLQLVGAHVWHTCRNSHSEGFSSSGCKKHS